MKNGCFVISLDFELMWGMIDVAEKDCYGLTNVKQVPIVIDRMLELFQRYGVHATFATVGMIMYEDKDSLKKDIPTMHPSYNNIIASPYENGYINKITKDEECLFFQQQIVNKLKNTDGIEIGTHTYCHYYCWEKGQVIEQFDADIKKACEVAKQNGIKLKSIVFPRNEVSDEYLKICAKYGITSYRGNAIKYFSEPKTKWENIKNRICRLLDAYINIGGMCGVPLRDIDGNETPINLRASRMLRPYTPKLSFLEALRLRRIKKEMLHAAKHNQMYHIWWHPHNFGTNMDENFDFLESILIYYKELNTKYNFKSLTMGQLCNEIQVSKH